MIVVAVCAMPVTLEPAETLPGAPEHPERNADNDHTRNDQKPCLEVRGEELAPERQASHGNEPHDERMGKSRADAKEYRLTDGATNCDDVGGHHRFRMSGLQAMQSTEEKGEREIEPSV